MWRKRVWVWGIFIFLVASWPVSFEWPDDKEHISAQDQITSLQFGSNSTCTKIVVDSALYEERWDTLIQPKFWRYAMDYEPDTVIVNIAKSRHVIEVMPLGRVRSWSERRKKRYEDSLRNEFGLRKKDEIFFTTGRKHFYQFDKVLPEIDKAIEIFLEEGTDPWYAQAILLIESPGRLQFSTEGAYGAFQLMEGVAREQGLVINDSIDEREVFDKSAMGAARLIRRVCLPHARNLCKQYKLPFEEHDIWFRLLVMHVYHAGIGNVRRVVRKVRPKEGGISFITSLWQTRSRRFGNASQNYSQITLASLMELDELILRKGIICPLAQTEEGELVRRGIR